MPLEFKLDNLDGLDNAIKALYKKDEKSGKYQLDVDGIDSAEKLKVALGKERDERKKRQTRIEELEAEKEESAKKAKEAESERQKAIDEASRKSGDTEALDKSWKKKYDDREAELQGEISTLNTGVNTMAVDNVAVKLANELAVQGSADLLIPHIKIGSDTIMAHQPNAIKKGWST